MEKVSLSRGRIEDAKPADKPYRIWDAKVPGLFLRVQPSGAKLWNVQWSRAASKSLGKYPALTLDGARTRALAILNDANLNGVPEAAKKRPKATTLRAFLDDEYAGWARTHLKRGDEATERIQRVYGSLLDLPLAEIDARAVEAIRTARLAAKASKSTCNRDLVVIKAALARAVAWGHLPSHPLAGTKPARLDTSGVVRYLGDEEEQRLRAALIARDGRIRADRESGNRWRAERDRPALPEIPADGFGDYLTPLVLVAINTGARRGELMSLTWTDVDLSGARLTIRGEQAKSGRTRHVPLNDEALDALTRWKAQRPDGFIFPVESPKKAWGALLDAAGVTDFRFHDLRHHFASSLVMAGIDLNTVRELLGHADIKMTLRYAHLAPAHKASAVQALSRKRTPAAPAPAGALSELVDRIGDEAQLRELLQKLEAKLGAG